MLTRIGGPDVPARDLIVVMESQDGVGQDAAMNFTNIPVHDNTAKGCT
jgi:hypothetical protein